MILNLSDGVKVSSKKLIVSLTSPIFSPCIEPLLSITHIKSTLVLLPPDDLSVAIAGRSSAVLSLTRERCAFISSSSLVVSFVGVYLTFSISGSSSL